MKNIYLAALLSVILFSCKKNDPTVVVVTVPNPVGTPNPSVALPIVTTATVTLSGTLTVSAGGQVISEGGAPVTERGVCWGLSDNPTISGSHTSDGGGLGIFTTTIGGLTASTTYHFRAFAINSGGTMYGNEIIYTSVTPDVYVAGAESGSTNAAQLWKNAVLTPLYQNGPNGGAKSVFVSGTDVYVAGILDTAALIWKNGWSIQYAAIPCGVYDATSIFVEAPNAIYTTGFKSSCTQNQRAYIIRTGLITYLTNGVYAASGNSIFVSGPDVYVVGYETTASSNKVAKLWKNTGFITPLTGAANNGDALSVVVSGTDFYIAGWETAAANSVAKIWKNAVASSLTNGAFAAQARSVFVAGTDVYAGGFESNGTKDVAKIWKNGVATALTNGAYNAGVNSIFVYGTDVYAVGYESNGVKNIAKIWKNGIATSLSSGTNDAVANSVYVK